jgi:hypothetical protein
MVGRSTYLVTVTTDIGQNVFTWIGQLHLAEAEGTWLMECNASTFLDADFYVKLWSWSGLPLGDLLPIDRDRQSCRIGGC